MGIDFSDYGLGFIDDSITWAERITSWLRGKSVATGYRPSRHPDFAQWYRSWSQSSTSACTGFGTIQMASCMASSERGSSVPLWSAFAAYYDGRNARGRANRDDGASVKEVMQAFNKYGPIDEVFWPCQTLDAKTKKKVVNKVPHEMLGIDGIPESRRPSTNVARLSGKRNKRVYKLKMHRIDATEHRLIERVAHSLDKGQVCGVSVPVSRDFDRRTTDVLRDPSGKTRGWHWVAILDWRIVGGEIELLVGNSWGSGWGDCGTRWAAPSFMKKARSAWYVERVTK